jgi:hypothetical protein
MPTRGEISRVGPHGYIHGWIFVGAPGAGDRVFHPHHGHGTVTGREGKHATVKFGATGTEHSFEVRPGAKPATLQPRGGAGLAGDALWASNQGKAPAATADELRAAQDWWYGRGARYTNAFLRGDKLKAPLDDAEKQEIGTFLGLVNRAPVFTEPVVLHRGVANGADSSLFGDVGSRVGKRFTDPGLVSATADASMAANAYAPADKQQVRTVVRISAPAGSRALKSAPEFFGPGRSGAQDYNVHQEYTFPPGTVFRVTGDKVAGGVRSVDVTVEPPRR